MIVIGSVLAIVLIGAYLFLGMKISESIVNADVKIFFWALYTVTLISIVNVSLSIYFYSTVASKKGPLGPRGIQGKLGEKGKDGQCKSINNIKVCKLKTVQIMVEEAIQNFKEEEDITPMERKTICNMVNFANNKSKITSWILPDLQAFRNYLYDDTNYSSITQLNNNLDERIKNQNAGESLVWVKNLIQHASNVLDATKHLVDVTTDASECN